MSINSFHFNKVLDRYTVQTKQKNVVHVLLQLFCLKYMDVEQFQLETTGRVTRAFKETVSSTVSNFEKAFKILQQ